MTTKPGADPTPYTRRLELQGAIEATRPDYRTHAATLSAAVDMALQADLPDGVRDYAAAAQLEYLSSLGRHMLAQNRWNDHYVTFGPTTDLDGYRG